MKGLGGRDDEGVGRMKAGRMKAGRGEGVGRMKAGMQ